MVKVFLTCVLIVSILLVAVAPVLAEHGNYNSRVIPISWFVKYMESNSWYWTYFPYLGVKSRHYGDEGWTGEYYIDTVSYGNYNITRAHAAHYHETRGGRVKGTHSFLNHGYWYYRYTDTYWIW